MKPRAIFFGFDHDILYRSQSVLLRCLSKIFDLVLYGPGYTDNADLDCNLSRVCKKLGPFDAVFTDLTTYMNPQQKSIRGFINSGCAFIPKNVLKYEKLDQFGVSISEIDAPKFLSLIYHDIYSFSETEFLSALNFPGFLLCSHEIFISPKTKTAVGQEKFCFPTTRYYSVLAKKKNNSIIPFCHAVFDQEVLPIPQKFRWDLAVPGALYFLRKKIFEKMSENQHLKIVAEHPNFEHLNFFLSLVAPRHRTNKFYIKMAQYYFTQVIQKSFCSFTDGSRTLTFVRKFLEIPAYGGILLADPFHNASKMGFVDRHNYLNVTEETIIDDVEMLLRNRDYADFIRCNGQELIRKSHSETAWIHHIKDIWRAIQLKEFNGCFWDKGILHLKKKVKST